MELMLNYDLVNPNSKGDDLYKQNDSLQKSIKSKYQKTKT